jgi:general secretion pathway protein B
MSYILDALRKAERERGISQVPTLATVHDILETPRNRIWAVSAAALALLAAGLGLYILIGNDPDLKTAESRDFAARQQETDSQATGNANTPRSTDGEASSAFNQRTQPWTIAPNGSSLPASETGRMNSGSLSVPPSETATGFPRVAGKETRDSNLPARTVRQPIPSESENSSPEVLPTKTSIRSSDIADLSDIQPALKDTASRTAALLMAMEGMNISILQYAEAPSERLVFINGRKYVEGDYIDGVYYIKTITQDGAILSFEGVQETLRLKTY